MAALTTEAVTFTADGAETLAQQYEKIMGESLRLKVANAQLSRQLNDGSFIKQARDVQRATSDLKKYSDEQKKVYQNARLQIAQDRYGKLGGRLAVAGSRVSGGLGAAARAAGGGVLSGAAAFGLPIGIGALASRGFSGSAPMAQFQNEIDRLGRSIASDLLPVLQTFTRTLNTVNNSRDKLKRGGGELSDVGKGYALEGLAGWGIASKLGFRPAGYGIAWGRAAGGAGLRAAGGLAGRAGLGALGAGGLEATGMGAAEAGGGAGLAGPAAPIAAALLIFNMRRNARARDVRAKGLAAGDGFTDSEKADNADLLEAGKKIRDDKERAKFYRGESMKAGNQERALVDKHNKPAPHWTLEPFQALGVALFGGAERTEAAKLSKRSEYAARLASGKSLDGNSTPDMQFVEGAGRKSSGMEIYEEIAQGLQPLGVKPGESSGGNAMERTAAAAEKILDWLNTRIPI